MKKIGPEEMASHERWDCWSICEGELAGNSPEGEDDSETEDDED